MPKLAIIQLDDYNRDELLIGMRAAFNQLNLTDVIKPDEQIVIKPNLLSALAPDRAVTSHPEVFRALVACLRDLGSNISYGDSPAIDSTEKAARASGLMAMADELQVPLADFITVVETPMPAGKVMRQIPLAKGVADADGLVSLSKLKTHALTGMTGAIKNQFGVIPGQLKAACHVKYPEMDDFAQMLVDINRFLMPRLYVMDAIVAMEGNGPRNGHPRKVGAVLLSVDPVAIDAAGSMLMTIDPAAIRTTCLAQQSGLGSMDLAAIEACLIQIEKGAATIKNGTAAELLHALQVKDFIKGRIARTVFTRLTSYSAPVFKKHIMRRPAINPNTCIKCGICVDACPVAPKVLSQAAKTETPTFAYARCIRCYCCQEVCPVGAIDVHVTPIGHMIGL